MRARKLWTVAAGTTAAVLIPGAALAIPESEDAAAAAEARARESAEPAQMIQALDAAAVEVVPFEVPSVEQMATADSLAPAAAVAAVPGVRELIVPHR